MSEVLTRPVGAILVGGSSRRMGEDKARVMLGTTTMFDHVARALEAAGCEVIAIGRPPGDFDVPTYPDDDPAGAGPASGLETALRIADGRPVVLVATDQPFLSPRTVGELLGIEGDAVVPLDDGIRQTTCAVYRAGCADPLADIRQGRPQSSLQHLLDAVDAVVVDKARWSTWGEAGRSWWSVDTPEELAKARDTDDGE